MFPKKIHHIIFLIGTTGLVVGLPLSPFLLNASQLLLSLNWLLELNYRNKLKILASRKSILILASIYLLHLIWLINTSDFNYAWDDLQIKLPLLALPIIYGTASPILPKEFKSILQFFVVSVVISSIISTSILLGLTKLDPIDSRNASLIISHIRFSLLIVISIFILFYYCFLSSLKINRSERIINLALISWLVVFLVLLGSFTGIIIFIVLVPVVILWWSYKNQKKINIKLSYILILFLLASLGVYAYNSYHRFNKKYKIDVHTLERKTINGNDYKHYVGKKEYENGHLVWIYLCEKELHNEWNHRSTIKYGNADRKEQPINTTLIRYLSSFGYRKDSIGISKLEQEDVEMIEKGYTNYLYKNKFSLYPRIYEMLWELERYKNSNDPSGRSIAQRIEYSKTALGIIKRNFWLGTGTGDLKEQFQKQYEIDHSLLKLKWRHRAHNQFITFLVSFGIFGLMAWLFILFYPPVLEKKYKQFLFLIFFITATLSMLNEDTLETSAGVSFFAFFYSFFFFMDLPDENSGNEKSD